MLITHQLNGVGKTANYFAAFMYQVSVTSTFGLWPKVNEGCRRKRQPSFENSLTSSTGRSEELLFEDRHPPSVPTRLSCGYAVTTHLSPVNANNTKRKEVTDKECVMKEKQKRFLRYREVEAEYGIKRSFLEQHREIGRSRAGRSVLFKREDIQNFLEQNRQEDCSNLRQLVSEILKKVRGEK